jgi:3-oxoacyl-[acyl-carrier-protein] synthase II
MTRVVITGWGAVTPLGLSVDEMWAAMVAGHSGIAALTGVEVDDLPTRFGGEVTGFDPKARMKARQSRRMDPYAQYAFAAADEALAMAKLRIDEENGHRAGVLVGSGYGPTSSIARHVAVLAEYGPTKVSPFAQIAGAIDSAACEISFAHGITGPTRAISSACASGADAIGEAARWIRHGALDMAVAGGAEHILTRLDLATSGNALALSTRNDDPAAASRPFDEDRDGFVMSAGAGIVVLEAEEHALARGAAILAEVAGYASTSDAYHWTTPDPTGRGVRAAMRGALVDAGLDASEVDYVNAHGTGTTYNDQSEVDSLHAVLGERVMEIPVSSTKSMTGHLIGAAGAVEAIACGLAIADGVVPPTINCHKPIDPTVNFVPHTAQEHAVRVAMSNSFGFGGHNAVLVLRRWEL